MQRKLASGCCRGSKHWPSPWLGRQTRSRRTHTRLRPVLLRGRRSGPRRLSSTRGPTRGAGKSGRADGVGQGARLGPEAASTSARAGSVTSLWEVSQRRTQIQLHPMKRRALSNQIEMDVAKVCTQGILCPPPPLLPSNHPFCRRYVSVTMPRYTFVWPWQRAPILHGRARISLIRRL